MLGKEDVIENDIEKTRDMFPDVMIYTGTEERNESEIKYFALNAEPSQAAKLRKDGVKLHKSPSADAVYIRLARNDGWTKIYN